MVATLTTVAGMLKEVYEPRFTKQYNEEVVLNRRLEKTSRGVTSRAGGHYVDFPIVTGRSQSIGYRQENEALQAAGAAEYTDVHIPLKYGYFRGALTGQVIRLAEHDYQAFASGMRKEMDIAKESVVKDSNRIGYGDGTGLLATVDVASAGASTSISVADPVHLQKGQIIDVLVRSTGAAVTNGGNKLITNLVKEADGTGTVTVPATGPDTLTTHGLYRFGNYSSGPTIREPSGLDKITANTGVYLNVDPANFPSWKGEQFDEAGALAESSMITMCDRIRANGGMVTAIFTSLGVRRAYFNLLSADRQFHNTQTFQGGFEALPFTYGKTIPVVEDIDAPKQIMWFVSEPKLTIYRESAWHFMAEDGQTLKYVSGFDRWEYLLRQYWEYGTDQRGAHGKMFGITEA